MAARIISSRVRRRRVHSTGPYSTVTSPGKNSRAKSRWVALRSSCRALSGNRQPTSSGTAAPAAESTASPAPSSSALPGFTSRLVSPICRVQLPSLTSRKVHVSSSAVSSSLLPVSRTVSAFTFAWIFSRSAFILRILSENDPPGSRESAFPHDTTSAPWGQDKLTGGYFA